MFKENFGKRTEGCSTDALRTSNTNGQNTTDINLDNTNKTENLYRLMKPYHIRLAEYRKARERIFGENKISRSSRRIREFYKKIKMFKICVISPIISQELDSRPYINLKVNDKFYMALLDSGANKSVIGGDLAIEIQNMSYFRKCLGNVRTADGQRQNVIGTAILDITFQGQKKQCEFLVVPSIRHDLICGYDFWSDFGLKISLPNIGEIDCVNEDSDKLKLTVEQQQKLDKVIATFPNSKVDGLGRTTLIKHSIDTGDAKPIKQRYYPISPAVEKQISGEIERMLSLGVIEEAPNSSWSSPTVVVVKPGKVRMCVDSRKLNSVTVKDAYPIPNIDGLISRLPPVHYISKIDLKDAFWQVELDEESKPKTAFTVPNRPLYQFRRMPFGLCNAPQTLCRLMDKVIPYNLKSHVFVYLDDLLVVSQTFEEHLTHLMEVSTNLRKANLTINVEKSSFGLSRVKYLGYVVGHGTLQVDQEKIKAIEDFPVPKSIKQLRRFLGMTGWYRRFIQDFSTITFPLTEMLTKKKTFVWTDKAQEAFDQLKTRLTSAPLLIHPNYSKPFILQCDASTHGVGAVLAQKDDNGIEKPIAYMSHKLNKAQRNYTITELECLAVVMAIKKFRPYIEGLEFKVVTDHASLKWLMGQRDLSGRLARWSLKLQGFNFTIEHRSGRENIVPDALSRVYEGEDFLNAIELETLPAIDLDSDAFKSDEYSKLKEEIQNSNLPDFKLVDGYIYKRTEFSSGEIDESNLWKLMVPIELRQDVIYSAHNTPTSAHSGIAKTIERIRRYFYWPRLATDVKEYILNCKLCKTSKTQTNVLRPPLGHMPDTERPFQRLYVDLIGPFPRSKKGHIGLLIVLDHFSKFTFLKPLKKFVSKEIINYLQNEIFCCYGVPETLVSDNGSQFRSKDFEKFLTKYGVHHILTAVYSPQANASERVNRCINEALRSYIRNDQREWDRYTDSINCSLRNSIHQSIGRTPYQVVFGQTMVTHGKDYKLLRKLNILADSDSVIERQDEFTIIRDKIKHFIKKAYDKNARIYNLRSRFKDFNIGQHVIRRNFTQSSKINNFNSKLAPVGIEAKVLRKIGRTNYELQDLNSDNIGVYHAKDIWN